MRHGSSSRTLSQRKSSAVDLIRRLRRPNQAPVKFLVLLQACSDEQTTKSARQRPTLPKKSNSKQGVGKNPALARDTLEQSSNLSKFKGGAHAARDPQHFAQLSQLPAVWLVFRQGEAVLHASCAIPRTRLWQVQPLFRP